MVPSTGVKFADVAGVDEAKQDLEEVSAADRICPFFLLFDTFISPQHFFEEVFWSLHSPLHRFDEI